MEAAATTIDARIMMIAAADEVDMTIVATTTEVEALARIAAGTIAAAAEEEDMIVAEVEAMETVVMEEVGVMETAGTAVAVTTVGGADYGIRKLGDAPEQPKTVPATEIWRLINI